MSIRTVHQGWRDALIELVSGARGTLAIVAPFITKEGKDLILAHVSNDFCESGQVQLVTNLSPAHVCEGSLDVAAVAALLRNRFHAVLWHVPALHAKVYLADNERAIVTSGNLTRNGLYSNVEYGIDIRGERIVRTIKRDVADFQTFGVAVGATAIDHYAESAQRVRETFVRRRERADPRIRRAFRDALRSAEDELIRLRLSGGAMHTVFARTIEVLLRRHGPLATRVIHQQIQGIHPDLCDDSVDRIIDGKSYGKKWKHAVRTAQQYLKSRGLIELRGRAWRLVRNGGSA